MSTFAKTLFTAAAEVEAAETSIKRAILAAAEAGDTSRVVSIVSRWLDMPPTEVLAALPVAPSMELDPCGDLEVTQGEHPGAGDGSPQP